MQIQLATLSGRIERPPCAWLAIVLEVVTGNLAIPGFVALFWLRRTNQLRLW